VAEKVTIIQTLSWLAPEILKPYRRQLGIAHRVLDVAMLEVSLQDARIVVSVGGCVYAPLPGKKHRM
jgi:hypothetical protein